jgi:CheY-like chemotaxis protein
MRSAPESLSVLVVSWDAAFRRAAGAALSRAGHEVHVASSTGLRAERLVRLRHPDVVLADVSTGGAPPLLQSRSGDDPIVVVLATVDAQAPALEKWGPLDELVRSVEDAVDARPRLRLVTPES